MSSQPSPKGHLYLSCDDIINNASYITDDRTFTDPRGNGIYVKDDIKTVVSLVATYGIIWDSKGNKWKPLFHTGLLFSGSFQSAKDSTEFQYCLLHGVPTNQGTTLELHFGNSVLQLKRILASFIPSAGWEDYTKAFGKTDVRLSYLAAVAVSVLKDQFVLSGLRDRILSGSSHILPAGKTNCVDVCCKLLQAMSFNASFNDLLVRILVKCYLRVGGNKLKYVCDKHMWNVLATEGGILVNYQRGISSITKYEQCELERVIFQQKRVVEYEDSSDSEN